MEKKPKFNIGDTAYFIKDNRIIKGEVTAVIANGDFFTWFKYVVDKTIEGTDDDMFKSKSEVLEKVLTQLHLDAEKVLFICKTLFPEEHCISLDNELTDDDFEKLETKEEPLKIEEKTSFWKGLFK